MYYKGVTMKPRSIRISDDDLKHLQELGVDLSELVRSAIRKVLDNKRCPTCGAEIKGKRNEKVK